MRHTHKSVDLDMLIAVSLVYTHKSLQATILKLFNKNVIQCNNNALWFNSSPPSTAYMRHWIGVNIG